VLIDAVLTCRFDGRALSRRARKGDSRAMKNLRRGLLVAGMAILAGVVVRFLGRHPVPPTTGGWRALEGPDLR
jgi:hypothetical protein